jgi:hypothetical protein
MNCKHNNLGATKLMTIQNNGWKTYVELHGKCNWHCDEVPHNVPCLGGTLFFEFRKYISKNIRNHIWYWLLDKNNNLISSIIGLFILKTNL